MLGDIFDCHNGGILLESRGQKQEMLLNILQCTGQLPTAKKVIIWFKTEQSSTQL